MIKRFLILLFVLSAFAPECKSQDSNTDTRVRELVKLDGQVEVTIPYSGIKSIDLLTRNVSILTVSDNIIHISLSPVTVEWFLLQKYKYQILNRRELKGLVSSANLNQAADWSTYPTYTQYDSIMRSFATHYPALCRLDTIGTSVRGKLVLALKISDNVSVDENEPEVFYSSSMHGDETGGFVLMLHLADYLLKNYQTSGRVKNMVDNLEIWINPLANPDGTYRTGNTLSSPTRYNANGADLNRSFPDPLDKTIVQQKETLDMIKFMRKHRFVISANFHAGTEVVNYPWDRWLNILHADNDWFNSISRAYADTVHIYSGPAYMNFLDNGVTRGSLWYVVYGGRQDFITWELQGREVTIELDDQYITPAAQLPLLWQNNYRSLLRYLENALYGIHGLAKDAGTSAAVAARVFIKGHDKDSSHVYSDSRYGGFVRMLSPGLWDLTFSAAGYKDTIIRNINVVSGLRTDLLVNLEKTDTTNLKAPVLFPNPASKDFKAILPEMIAGQVNIRIYNINGILLKDYNIVTIAGARFVIDINGLVSGKYLIVFTNRIKGVSSRNRFIIIK